MAAGVEARRSEVGEAAGGEVVVEVVEERRGGGAG